MGLFSTKTSDFPWKKLTSIEELHQILENTETPVLLFKHSTRCSISSFALKTFEREWNNDTNIRLYFLDLIAHRDVSNEIANVLKVEHQSPQAIVVKNGKVIYADSHQGISAEKINSLI